MSPLITTDRLESPDVLYPYYKDGYLVGIPEGLTPSGFYQLISSAMTFMKLYASRYNGELVGVFECRFCSGSYETHVTWFTKSKRKIMLSLKAFVQEKAKLITYVPKKDADGHHALARKGIINYLGEHNNMSVFKSC